MRDNDVIAVIFAEMNSQLSANGLSDVEVGQSYQPTQQSTSEGRALFMHKVSNPQVGTGFKYANNNRTQQYLKRATFQFDALAQQDPSDVSSLTAGDIANAAADLIQSYDSIRNLHRNGVNIEHITDVRPGYFINDKDRHESSPSFDLTVSYIHEYEKEIPSIDGIKINYHGV